MQPEGYCKTSRVMAESQLEAISLALNSTKLNATNSLFREDPSLVFSIVTEARDQTTRVSPRSRDPGNEVGHEVKFEKSTLFFNDRWLFLLSV